MEGPLCIFDVFDVPFNKQCNIDSKAPSGKLHNQHPYLVLNCLIKRYTYHFWVPLEFLKIYLICSSNNFTNTLTAHIYKICKIECCVLHLQQIRISKQTQSQGKKLQISSFYTDEIIQDEFQPCQSRGANFTYYAHKINTCPPLFQMDFIWTFQTNIAFLSLTFKFFTKIWATIQKTKCFKI